LAVDEIHVNARPEDVFAVLSDRRKYGEWVVGTEVTVEAEGDWPEPGSALRYTLAGPLTLSNRTVVLRADPPHRLELRAKAGPLPDALITIDVYPEGDGARVRMHERPAHPLINLLATPLGHFLLSRRNKVALDRLRRLAEAHASAGALP
jgi:uncharacterized protein YndB with AHSA1/START domain